VLVVDDESRIRLALRACLDAEGYEVEEAADGLAAMERVRQHVPQLIILDLSMPRLSGLAVLEDLHRTYGINQPPVIILTAYGSKDAAEYSATLGVKAFLEKPLLPDALRRTVELVLHGGSSASTANDPLLTSG
jgi:CheY-like chemotaxis protein